jgi:pimeloyl-ACP methyl ester carboxylesterase
MLHAGRLKVAHTLIAITLIASPVAAAQSGPARNVLVDGHVMHLEVTGRADGPTIVFEAGYETTLRTWTGLRLLLSDDARLVAYDRPGLGESAPCPRPETGRRVSEELHEALRLAGISPPYVLVGLSLGGPFIRVFTSQYPAEVSALVFVDPAHERFVERMKRELPETWAAMIRDGVPTGPAIDSTYAQAAASDPLPPIPIVVLTRDDFGRGPPELLRIWTEVNREWAAGMPTARHLVVPRSGHLIHMDQPSFVANIVRDMVRETRTRDVRTKRP